jgi:hypothetical protein
LFVFGDLFLGEKLATKVQSTSAIASSIVFQFFGAQKNGNALITSDVLDYNGQKIDDKSSAS